MFFNFKVSVCLTTCFCTLEEIKVGSHEFSRKQEIVTDGFPWFLGMEAKRLLSMGFEILGLDILSNQRLTRDDKHVPVDSP